MERATVNPKMVVLVRQSRGLTQSQLAAQASIPQARISEIEAGLIEVSGEALKTLASVLEYPEAFFSQTDQIFGFDTSVLFHRKRGELGTEALDRIHA